MLVVWNHAALLALKYLELPENSAHRMQWDLANAGVFGVDIFFVISGFVMAMSARRFDGSLGAIHFLAQRYNRIAPLFYLLSALLLADMLRAQVPFEVRDVLNTLTFVPWFDGREYHWPIHYLGWTLAFEFVFYGVVAALIWTGRGRHVVLLAAILAGLALAGALFDAPWMPLWMLTSPTMVEFGFGVVAYRAWRAGWFDRQALHWHLFLLAGMALFLWSIFGEHLVHLLANELFDHTGALRRLLWWGVPAFAIVCWALTLAPDADRWPRRVARLIGDATYSIYLTHLFVVRLAEELIQRSDLPVVLVAVSVMIISPIVGWASYRLVEQPLMRVGQGWIRQYMTRLERKRSAVSTARGSL